jgi:hypothetical protein
VYVQSYARRIAGWKTTDGQAMGPRSEKPRKESAEAAETVLETNANPERAEQTN